MKRFGVAFASIFLISVLAVSFPIAFPGKRQVAFCSFINLFHLDASRASFRAELPKEGFETRILTFKLDPKECFVYPAAAGYDYLRIADLKPATKPGEPQLPMKTFVVELEKSDQVYGVEVVDGLVREIDGELNILPTSQPVAWEPGARQGGHIPDERVYGMGKPFPGKLVSYETGKDSERQYVFVRLFPVQYTPSKKKAVVLTETTIKLYYGTSSAESEFTGQGLESTDAQCVIICPTSLKGVAQTLSNFHSNHTYRPIASTVVTTDAISSAYDPAEDPPFSGYKDRKLRGRRNIKNYNYELAREIVAYLRSKDGNGLEYVTILGDALLVPPSYYYSEKGGWYSDWIPTDFLYASPDYDFTPNFKLGRISVNDALEADRAVQKIMSWDANAGWSWFGKAWLVGGDAHPEHLYCAELNLTNVINLELLSGMDITKRFHTEGTHTKVEVLPSFTTAEVGLLYHLGHGSGYSIALDGDDITVDDLMGYELPSLHIPVVFSVSCDNAAFDLDLMERSYALSFGESVIKSQAGGIAYIGGSRHNTGDSEWVCDENGNLQIMDTTYILELFLYALEAYHLGKEDTVGGLCDYGLRSYVVNNSLQAAGSDPTDVATVFRHVLMGDPALSIPLQVPQSEYQMASCTLDLAYMGTEDIPVYSSPPVVLAATDSPKTKWKLIDADNDITYVLGEVYDGDFNGSEYVYEFAETCGYTDAALYLVCTATCRTTDNTNFARENWLLYRIEEGAPGGRMHVSSIDMSYKVTRYLNVYAEVTVVDDSNSPVEGATVYGIWGWNEPSGGDILFGVTNRKGKVKFAYPGPLNKSASGVFTFEVTNVVLADWIYDSQHSGNVPSGSIEVP